MFELIQKYADASSSVKLALSLERLVREGRISTGATLPPVRQLADALDISPGTAAAAYKTLRDRGLASGDRRRGTRILGETSARDCRDVPAPAGAFDLRVANPDPALVVDLGPIFKAMDITPGRYDLEHVTPELSVVAGRMFEDDGIAADHLFVAGGAIGALHYATRASVAFGDRVAVEDPGFNDHHALVAAVGCSTVPLAMDDEGPLPEAVAEACRAGVRAVLMTARCQSPTGAMITRTRAAKLREALHGYPDVAVLVDDYGAMLCEQPYEDAIGKRAHWCVVRSFNKVIAPDLRVAVAVGDAQTIERMHVQQGIGDGWISSYLQRACAEALKQKKLFRTAARTYTHRREALLEALHKRGIEAHGVSGFNVWIPVRDEATVVAGLAARGFHIRAGTRYRLKSAPAVRVTTARLDPKAATTLAEALAEMMGRSGRAP